MLYCFRKSKHAQLRAALQPGGVKRGAWFSVSTQCYGCSHDSLRRGRFLMSTSYYTYFEVLVVYVMPAGNIMSCLVLLHACMRPRLWYNALPRSEFHVRRTTWYVQQQIVYHLVCMLMLRSSPDDVRSGVPDSAYQHNVRVVHMRRWGRFLMSTAHNNTYLVPCIPDNACMDACMSDWRGIYFCSSGIRDPRTYVRIIRRINSKQQSVPGVFIV